MYTKTITSVIHKIKFLLFLGKECGSMTHNKYALDRTVKALCIGTDKVTQTVEALIRLLFKGEV